MTPYKQLYRHNPENNEYGDCFRTVIGCLLDLPPNAIPHSWHEDAREQNKIIQTWLAEKGLRFIEVSCDGSVELLEVLEIAASWHGDQYYTLAGTSDNNVGHIVICKGNKIVWDTSLDDSGITDPNGETWQVGFLALNLTGDFKPVKESLESSRYNVCPCCKSGYNWLVLGSEGKKFDCEKCGHSFDDLLQVAVKG